MYRVLAALLLLAVAMGQSAAALEVPREAAAYKRDFVRIHRQVWGLDNPAMLAAQIGQESGWVDGLTSRAGARGMCQFIAATAAGVEDQYPGLASWGRYSPTWCLYAQALHMRDLVRDYEEDRDACNAMRFALSAYNGGPRMLNREVALCKADDICDYEWWNENVAVKNARAGWAWRENRTYVARISLREQFYAADGWGKAVCGVGPEGDGVKR